MSTSIESLLVTHAEQGIQLKKIKIKENRDLFVNFDIKILDSDLNVIYYINTNQTACVLRRVSKYFNLFFFVD